MRRLFYFVFFAASLSACNAEKPDSEPLEALTEYVNPFMGTEGPGNTYPGAQVPFGMVQMSPDNEGGGWYRISGYDYPDSVINSFSMTHLSGTGAGDLYDFAFMPALTRAGGKNSPFDRTIGSTFSHDNETASPGYYAVRLDKDGTVVELTATQRCGV
ncbi:MAG: glycoside hydrolase family 92 protein, partial [Rikenellaceae bacterium]|nr:glycoside hydrolase family 92 protein [Rikenellaceae bacterium]